MSNTKKITKMKYIIILILSSIVLLSCNKQHIQKATSSNIIISQGSNKEMLEYYQKHTNKYDVGVSLQSTNNTSFKNFGNTFNGYLQYSLNAFSGTNKIPLETIKQMNFKIGNYNLSYDSKYEFNRTTQAGNNQDNIIVDLFNMKNISINIPYNNSINRTTDINISNPTPIYFISPTLSFDESAITTNNSFLIKWNKDDDNKNGVIIVLSWHGETVSRTKKLPDNDLKVIKTVDDDGTELIDDAMLQYFPDDALIDIAIGRGNIETSNNNGYSTIVESLTYAYERFGVKK